MNRRKILGGMIAAPFAGKKIAEAGMATAVQSLGEVGMPLGPNVLDYSTAGTAFDTAVGRIGKPQSMWKLFRQHGIPAWMREEFDYNFDDRRVGHDVAALRSVSEAGKRMIERERAWRRHVEQTLNPGWSELQEIRQAWYRKLGL